MTTPITLTVNGRPWALDMEPSRSLVAMLREEMDLTGTKIGCDDCECGACMVLVDGRPVNSCSYLAVQTDQREVTTIEGLASGEALHPMQQAFIDEAGVQCGFCTPGIIMAALGLLAEHAEPTEEQIRHALGGNLCRCTGYAKIVKAIQRAAGEISDRPPDGG